MCFTRSSIVTLILVFFILCESKHVPQRETSYDEVTQADKGIKVGIVGAGITGLYAALLLNELGINYEILEAADRTGGRIYTHYFDKSDGTNYNYVDMGAMRFPITPEFDIITGKQNWSLISFLNNRMKEEEHIKLIPFVMEHANNIFYFNGKKEFRSKIMNCSKCFGFRKSDGGYVEDRYTLKAASFWEEKAFEKLDEKVKNEGLKYLLKADHKTFREFLMDPKELNYDSEVIDWIEAFDAETGRFGYSLMDIYLADVLLLGDLLSIDGGSSKLINAMVSVLNNKPKLKHQVKAVTQLPSKELLVNTNKGSLKYTDLILTPTFTALRAIDFQCSLSLKKKIAMRTLNYAFTLKVGLQFKTRFWENSKTMNGTPILGGVSVTDLPIRQVVYPSYGINCTSCPGAILASYVWSQDAQYFIPYTDKEIVHMVLRDLAILHGPTVYKEYTGKYEVMDWMKNPYTQGAYGVFAPGDFESFFPNLVKPEANGRMHFAGEIITIYHGWSNGCLMSAFRAVKNILKEHQLHKELNQLLSKWGNVKDTADIQI